MQNGDSHAMPRLWRRNPDGSKFCTSCGKQLLNPLKPRQLIFLQQPMMKLLKTKNQPAPEPEPQQPADLPCICRPSYPLQQVLLYHSIDDTARNTTKRRSCTIQVVSEGAASPTPHKSALHTRHLRLWQLSFSQSSLGGYRNRCVGVERQQKEQRSQRRSRQT